MGKYQKKGQNYDGQLLHAVATRMRVVGSGTLKQTLNSLDDAHQYEMPDLTMQASTNREPTTLANFTDQRIQLIGKVENIDEWFEINKIVIFVRPSASGYPQ